MKITLKKIIKAFIPYGIIRLKQQHFMGQTKNRCAFRDFLHSNAEDSSKFLLLINDLIKKEKRYGGYITNVKRNKVSQYDPRSKDKIETGGMTGGDRMSHHGYACKYAEYLLHFLGNNIVLAEIGILKGSGLAIWCDLFPSSKILGLDIDLGHIQENMENLKGLGAFRNNTPELYEFDQFKCDSTVFEKNLNGRKINICIDDGFHSNKAILNTLQSVEPYLSNEFVYFIEDNLNVHEEIKKRYPQFKVDYENELTILTRRLTERD